MNHDLPITSVNISSINEIIQPKHSITPIGSGPIKEIFKKIKTQSDHNKQKLKQTTELNDQLNKNITDKISDAQCK